MSTHNQRQNRALAGNYSGYQSDAPNIIAQDYAANQAPGHPLWVFNGYGVNPARNNGADVEPIPITPVKHQNWPAMQIQLLNGWMLTNWGRKMSYDDYLRLLTTSENKARSYTTPGPNGAKAGFAAIGPSPLNVQTWAQQGPGAQASNPGGPGQVMGSLEGRRYYG